ncbi:MAG: helical backbone metal receptor, partial [Hymenobacteraceae bacterium]|nr:helical backbone metal receptor [Hymenobacteraceae bacterium]MDX5397881.1 helical backbone metal receptor [Hymenobacteraceae bacterium]MDX5513952.1 helical backbone metal receptor [Hymenobacteraceae bacterium]
KLNVPAQPQRVMALAPSMTEMLFAVCDTATIVARTQNCNHPKAALAKPVVNNYPMDYEQLLLQKPDIVFTVDGITPQDVAARLEELGVPVYYQKYETLDDIFTGLEEIGKIMDREQQAKQLTDSLRKELQQLQAQPKPATAPTVLAITWPDPIHVYGKNTLLTEKLKLIGAENAMQEDLQNPYPPVTREYVLKLNPDVILGQSFEKMDENFFSLYPELKQIKAYQTKQIYEPTDDLMSRPSPRVVESVKELQELIF